MARYPQDLIETIGQSVDLAELVGRYVPLKRAGKAYKACCPFHQEKTPSFNVTPERGIWKCFGCGKGGNAFQFLMEREGMTFPEAVRQLAKETGVALPDDDPAAAEQASRTGRLREVMERACRFYEKALRSPDGDVARAYFKRRGIEERTIERFRLGFAPPGWQNLIDAAQSAGIPEADLVDLGLARRKEAEDGRPSRFFDMFRGRVMFPICDTQGHVIAFGARTLGDDEPKYLNSPETPLFTKGRTVYALHLAKQEMMKPPYEGAVMEGYTDVIMAHQCGWPVAVAGLGTALTREQASAVARYVKRLYLVYDGDAAGLKAAEKNAPTFLPEAIETRVAVLPPGEDPCDTLLRAGLPALRTCLDASREAFDHLLAVKAAAHDMTSVPGMAQALDSVLEALAPVTDEVRRALYVKRVSDEYRVHEEVVWNRLREIRTKAARRSSPSPPAPQPDSVPASTATQVSDSTPAPAPASSKAARPASPPSPTEEQLIEALLGRPELCAEASERLPVAAIGHPLCRSVLDRLMAIHEETGAPPSVDAVMASIEEPELASFAAGLLARGVGKDLERQGRDCIARLSMQHELRRVHEVDGALPGIDAKRGELAPDVVESLRRLQEFHKRRASGG